MTKTPLFDLSDHVALVTGGNHGIGAATALTLAECGARVLVSYLRLDDEADPGIPESYRRNRASDAEHVLAAIGKAGGESIAVEADLADPATPRRLFDTAEAKLGPADILVNNATGWLADTFTTETRDRLGRNLARVSTETFEQQFAVYAGGTAAMISEFASRHSERGASWGRIIGLTSGGRADSQAKSRTERPRLRWRTTRCRRRTSWLTLVSRQTSSTPRSRTLGGLPMKFDVMWRRTRI